MDNKEDGKYTEESQRVLDEKIDRLEQWLLEGDADDEAAATSAFAEARVGSNLRMPERADGLRTVRAVGSDVDHSGHRLRMRRTAAVGLDGMSDIQLVELLLSYVVPRKDTNPIAHRLLDAFGSVSKILHAPADRLVKISGMTANAALLLTVLGKLYVWDGVREIVLKSPSDAADLFGSMFAGGDSNGTYVAFLDAKYRLIIMEMLGKRPEMSAVIGSACKYNASSIIIARREKDRFPDAFELTDYVEKLTKALKSINVGLLDFMIFTDYGYYTASVPKSEGEWQVKYVFVPSRAYSRSVELLQKVSDNHD